MKIFNHVNTEEWQEVADKCEYATFFHTPTWVKIFTETYPKMKIATKKYVLKNGNKIIVPLVKLKVMKRLFNNYISNPAGVYGGIISENNITQKEISKIFGSLMTNNTDSIQVTGNCLFDYDLPKQFAVKNDFTQIIRLEKNEKDIFANFKYSVRKQINKAKRAGLICREALNFDEWKVCYSIYEEALKRWGENATSSYPFTLFENMFKEDNSNIKLWLVLYDDKIVGGCLNFYHNAHCVEWHASFLTEYFQYGVRNLLVYSIILDAKKKGYRFYDFNPSGGHEGTMKFKETFGAERLPVKRWNYKNPFTWKIKNMKKKIIGE